MLWPELEDRRLKAPERQLLDAVAAGELDQPDAVYLKLHPDDTPAEGVLVAWGVTVEGRKVLLGLQLGSRAT